MILLDTTEKKIDSVLVEIEVLKRNRNVDKKKYEEIRDSVNAPIIYDGDEELFKLLFEFEQRLYNGKKTDTVRTIDTESTL